MNWRNQQSSATPQKPVKQSLRRFTWSRLHSDLPEKALWALVAKKASVELYMVEAFIWRLEAHANTNTPRGYVEDINIEALAAVWRVDDEAVARMFAALEDPAVCWIEQGYIATFWDRNPDHNDPTAAKRQQDRRARMKAAKLARDETRQAETFPQGVTRDSVTVTTRSDQITEKLGDLDNSGTSAPAASAEAWVMLMGKRIVCERAGIMPARASLEIARWARDLRGDYGKLHQIVHDADVMNLTGGRFTSRIAEQIARSHHEANGPPLPLPPIAIKKAGEG